MRYDDASQAGSTANDSAPVARPDLDALSPGSFGPATGNAITGEGTITGTTGADTVGDAPGQIVEVRGAGGASSGSGGNFQATGQYGVLSMDAQGNFNYVRNSGTPDGVQDVFGYTLADADGQTSSTTLAIDIAKVGSAQAAVIPGVVNLPPGVQLSDIRVSGRDLIVTLPDGSQMVIPGGAVFVPQLVIGDVQVPASNLAALLVESEPQPAAGQFSSSGGNFATDVPPLDPGVPLGDLIPPTELVFTLPDFEEVGDLIDEEPEAGVASVQLDDDDVPGKSGNAGGTGDDAGSANATASGFLPGSDGDGTLAWDLLITGAPAGFSYVDGPNGSVLVQQVQGGSTVTVLTITVDPNTGAFTVTENNPIRHAAGDNENNSIFVINYTVTDDDGDSAVGTLTINVDDDTPVVTVNAGPDAAVLLTTDDAQTIGAASDTSVTSANFGNVFTGTSVSAGADGAGPGTSSTFALAVTGSSSGLSSHGVAINLFVVSGVVVGTTAMSAASINAGNTVFTVSTTNTGVVTLTQFQQIDHPIGQDPTPSGTPFADQLISMADGLVTLTRSETVVDSDGDSVTGSAAVNIGANLRFTDDGPAISLADVGEPTLVVDETNLAANDTASFAANFAATFGADGPAVAGGGITYALGINAGATGLIDTLSGQAVVLSVVNGQIVGTAGAGGPTVFIVSVDASGNVTLDQQRAVIHSPDSGPDQTTTLAADNLVTLTATATDFDGDTASQTLNIGLNLIFHDDAPSVTAVQLAGTVDEDGVPGGIPGGPGDVAGEATVATGSVASLFNSGADQPLTFSLLTDTSGLPALTSNGVAVTYSVVGNTLTASAGGNTVFTFTVNADGSYTFTLVDQLDHPTLNGQAGDNTENDLTIALGSIIQATDEDGDSVTANANGLVITVDDDTPTASANQVTGTVDEDGVPGGIAGGPGDVAGEATVANGSVSTLFNSGADQPLTFNLLTDTSGLPALTSGGVAVTYLVVGNTLTASAGGNTVFTFVLNADGTFTFTLVDQLDHPTLNGQAGDNTENDLSIALGSIIQATDADGDSVAANANGLVITVDDDTPTNNASVVTLEVDEDAIAGGNAGGPNDGPGTLATAAASIAGLFNSGADQPLTLSMSGDTSGLPALTSAGVAVTYSVVGNTLTASAGGNTVFTLVLDPATGNVTFTLVDQLDHPTLNGQAGDNTENNLILDLSSVFQGTDADGDSVSLDAGSFTVDVDDDTPVATAAQVAGTVDEDGVPGGIAGGPGDVAGEATQATGSVTTLFSAGADAPLSFSLGTNLASLPALTSGGQQVTYQVAGNTLTASAGGNTVFTFVLNANGSWTFTLVDQIDHPTLNGQAGDNTENDLTIDLSSVVQATDADGDTVSAAANGLVITVDDDTPVAANDTDTVGAPGTTATGNVITDAAAGDLGDSDNGADSVGADQPGSIIALASVNEPGNTDTDPSPSIFSIEGEFGTLVMDSNGNYTYTRAAGSPGGAVDVFTYTLQDADGDAVTATLTITADDTRPVATTALAHVDDDGLTGGNPGGTGDENQNTGESPLSASETTWNGLLGGSGGDAPTQFLFSTSLTGTTAAVGQETVTYTVSGAGPAGFGTVLTATVTGGARNGTVLFTVTITDTATGAYTVQLLDNVLHPTLNGLAGDNTENNVSVVINYQLRDSDGDVSLAPGQLTIDFDDDTPITTANTSTGTVDEDGVPGGIAGGTGDVAGTATVANGSVSTLFAAGADAPLTFSLLTGTGGLPALTSNSVAVTYQVVGNTLTASAGGNTVFTFVLNADGTWTFTLSDQLDHPTLNGGAGDNTENDLTIDLSSIISATDADGDSVTAAANGLVITVDDDTPTTTANTSTGTVDEDGLTGGIAGGTGDVAGEAVQATGSVSTLFNSGADAPLTFSLLPGTGGLPALTSGGVAVTYAVVGNVLTASAGGNTVFTLTLNANGNWTFNLVRPLDHPTGDNENDLTIDLSSIISATDADGDSITAAPNALVITVDDDSPINFTPQPLTDDTNATVTEEDDALINDGNDVETNPLHDPNNDNVGENFIGADGFAATNGLVFTAAGHTNGEQLENSSGDPLTSGGDPIFVFGYGTGTLTATTSADNSDPAAVVFTVTLNQGTGFGSNSTYTIDFNQTIDNGSGVTFDDLTSTAAGNTEFRLVGQDDAATPVDLILSGRSNDGTSGTINTDSDSIGVDSQAVNPGAGVRIDLVSNLTTVPVSGSNPQGFDYDAHVTTTLFRQTIEQVQGNPNNVISINVSAIDADDDFEFDNTAATPEAGESLSDIIEVTVFDFTNANPPVLQNTYTFTSTGTQGAYTVTFNADGSVRIDGLGAHDQYQIETAGGDPFDTVIVDSLASNPVDFDLGVFSIGVVDTGDPIDLAFDVTATDRDGDTSTGTIDVTLLPASSGSSQEPLTTKSSLSVSDTLQQPTTNSNPVLMGALAAAGLMASESLAAQSLQDFGSVSSDLDSGLSVQNQAFSPMALDAGVSHVALGQLLGQMDVQGMLSDLAAQRSFGEDTQVRTVLDDFGAGDNGPALAQLAQGTDAPLVQSGAGGAGMVTAAAIAMPDAGQLLAAGLSNAAPVIDAQHNAVVGQVLADALHGGGDGPSVETLINAISTGGDRGMAVMDVLASHAAGSVPNGDMGVFAGFTGPHDMPMEQLVMHVDAAPAQV